MKSPRFLIVDAHGMLHRAVHRHGPPLFVPGTDEPVDGVQRFLEAFTGLVSWMRPDWLVVADDAPRHTTFRRRQFAGYKAHRDGTEPDPDVVSQITLGKDVLRAYGVPVLGADGFEADDVIASLVEVCASDEVEIVIASTDKDMAQLVRPGVRLADPWKRELWDEARVELEWGVPPDRIVDVQTLSGDASDGVPGVRGIGKKTAAKLIREHGSVEGVVRAAKGLTTSWAKSILDPWTDLGLQRRLVKLRTDTPLAIEVAELEFDGLDYPAAVPLLRRLGLLSTI